MVEENRSQSNIIGNKAAPFINQLAAGGAMMSQSFAEVHPSEPNYYALFAGDTLVKENVCPVNAGNEPNLGSQLLGAGYTFAGFAESLPAPGSEDCRAGKYARKHVPWASFTNIPANRSLPFSAFPAPANYGSLPTVSMVIPNLDNDMHDGSIAQGDQWLYQNLSQYASWARANNSLLILTWDEDDNTSRNQIPTVIYGAGVAARHLRPADQPLQRAVDGRADVRAAQARLRDQSARDHRHLGCLTPIRWALVAIVCRMAADLVPIRLSVTDGDRYTVWAPRWRDSGDEWEAFLGKDEDLYCFETVADLAAFVRTNTDNDLVDHPAWQAAHRANAHKLEPADDKQFDLIAVEELLTEKPTEESVTTLANALAIVSAIGSVCELPAVMKFFNGNPNLGSLAGGIDHFTGKAGLKRWHAIADIIGRSWDNVLGAVDEIVTTPDVDRRGVRAAAAELAEPVEPDELGDGRRRRPTTRRRRPTMPRTKADAGRAPATRWCSAATRTSGRRSASTRSGS